MASRVFKTIKSRVPWRISGLSPGMRPAVGYPKEYGERPVGCQQDNALHRRLSGWWTNFFSSIWASQLLHRRLLLTPRKLDYGTSASCGQENGVLRSLQSLANRYRLTTHHGDRRRIHGRTSAGLQSGNTCTRGQID